MNMFLFSLFDFFSEKWKRRECWECGWWSSGRSWSQFRGEYWVSCCIRTVVSKYPRDFNLAMRLKTFSVMNRKTKCPRCLINESDCFSQAFAFGESIYENYASLFCFTFILLGLPTLQQRDITATVLKLRFKCSCKLKIDGLSIKKWGNNYNLE